MIIITENKNDMKIIRNLLLFFLLTIFVSAGAQSQVDTVRASVRMAARVQPDKILLRWGVDKAPEWQKSNRYGFILEKYLYSQNGKRFESPQMLWTKNIKAEPLENWEKTIQADNNAAIIAQALYGSSFEVEEGSQGQLADIVNLTEELQQRFSFSLLAADMSFPAAVKAGWGYTDNEINKGEVYVYRVQSAVPEGVAVIESSAVIADPSKYEPLPAPTDLVGIWGDKNVLLTWEYALYKTIYTTYNIEKSEDGVNYILLNKTPLVNVNDSPEAPANRMYYIDSLAQNSKKYYYRVYGISPFGEKGSLSKEISGEGAEDLLYTPEIIDYQFTQKENEVVISWDFPKEGEKSIEKFQLNRAPADEGPYKVVIDNIAPAARTLTCSNLDPTNYFTITAIGRSSNQKKTSYSTLIQPIDSIPPVPPAGLKGSIDSMGIVKISWQPNSEKDLLGYRVFKGNLEDEEFSQITTDPIPTPFYTDSVKVASLNPKVFYKIVAVDKRFNNSDFSQTLTIEKPKVVPPSSPVFSSYKVENGAVILSWIPSPGENLTHQLYRMEENTSQWELVFQTQDTVSTFTDIKAEKDKTYNYQIRSFDESKLASAPSPQLTIKVTDLRPVQVILSIENIVSRERNYIELFWSVDKNAAVAEYTLYRKDERSEPTTWKVLPGSLTRVVDTNIQPGNTYIYYIRATLKDGSVSNLKSVEINF